MDFTAPVVSGPIDRTGNNAGVASPAIAIASVAGSIFAPKRILVSLYLFSPGH